MWRLAGDREKCNIERCSQLLRLNSTSGRQMKYTERGK